MKLLKWPLLAGVICCLSSAGCGGGGGGASDQERTIVLGRMTTRIVGTAQPPVSSSSLGSVVTGVAGASITGLTLSVASPALEDTRIAYYAVGSQAPGLYVVSPSGLDTERVWLNGYGNSEPTWSADGTKLMTDGSAKGYLPATTITDGTSNTLIVDSSSASSNKSNITTVFGDGSVRTVTTSGTDSNPAWWPASKVCYESFRDGNSEIYVMNSDGTVQTNLTKNPAADTNPCWSPDGNRIAYCSNRSGRNEIFQMISDGSSNTLLIGETTGGSAWDPQYSPDGTRICFVSSRDGNSEIYVADVSGLNQTRLTVNTVGDFDPSWSPDGTRIVWTRLVPGGSSEIWIMSANGAGQRRLVASGARPYWSPFVQTRTFIGASGTFGTAASGFLFGQRGDSTTSLLAFQATTPADARINALTPSGTNAPNFVFDVTASDAITGMQFANDFYLPPVTVIGKGGVAGATGALVTFNATTGKVSSVLPYTANRSAKGTDSRDGTTGIYRRQFLAILDSAGRNLAPKGASEVQIDTRTGAVTSFR